MLILVVGPSGAGKDTILGLARETLKHEPRFRFVRRVITRPPDVSGENHEAVSDAEFGRRSFALQWRAHGLRYGIPLDIAHDLDRGARVVANVSRGVIAEAASRFPTGVIVVTAPHSMLTQRLAARGRETAADIASRLAREVAIPEHVPARTVMNERTPADAAAQMVALLRSADPGAPGWTA